MQYQSNDPQEHLLYDGALVTCSVLGVHEAKLDESQPVAHDMAERGEFMSHRVMLLRHVQTEKNVRDIHGNSPLKSITELGHLQIDKIVRTLEEETWIEGMSFFDTPQAAACARELASRVNIPLEEKLSLRPFDLGIASGISSEQLRVRNEAAFWSLFQFRERLIDASKLEIPGAESFAVFERRLMEWWRFEGRDRFKNRLIIGTNSTLLAVTNLLSGNLPRSGSYFCHHIPNGSWKILPSQIRPDKSFPGGSRSWPDIETKRVPTDKGFVQVSVHEPAWGEALGNCVIAPG